MIITTQPHYYKSNLTKILAASKPANQGNLTRLRSPLSSVRDPTLWSRVVLDAAGIHADSATKKKMISRVPEPNTRDRGKGREKKRKENREKKKRH